MIGRLANKHSEHGEHGEHSVVSAGVSGVGKELLGCQGILELRPGPSGVARAVTMSTKAEANGAALWSLFLA